MSDDGLGQFLLYLAKLARVLLCHIDLLVALPPRFLFIAARDTLSFHYLVSYCYWRPLALSQHKNLLKHAKGYRGKSKNCYTVAIRRVEKAWQYAYRDRRRKKREYRKLWIMRLQAAVRQYGWSYSRFIPALKNSTGPNIQLNRKVLSDLAATEPFAFRSVVSVVEIHHQQQQQKEDEGDDYEQAA